jgi:hypothetical protein
MNPAPESLSPLPLGVGGQNSVALLSGFDGSNVGMAGSYIPPDVQVAAGPTYIVEMVNLLATVYTKAGVLVYSVDLPTFFIAGSDGMTDPRVYYDAASGRWFASISDTTASEVNVAVSETGDPTGAWFVYAFASGADPSYFADQPSLGVSSDKVVVSANMFDPFNNFVGTEIWALNRSELQLGIDTDYVDVGPDSTYYSIYPASNEGVTANLFMVSVDPSVSGSFTLFEVSGAPPGDVSFTNVTLPISDFTPPNGSVQRGTPLIIDSGDGRVVSTAYSGSKFWFAFPDFAVPAGDAQAQDGYRLVEVDTSSVTVLQDFDVNGAHTSYFYPALAFDGAGNLIVLFGASSSTSYPGLMVTAQRTSDPPDTFEVPAQVFNGTGAEIEQPSGGGVRYGDYFGASIDPSNSSVVWVAGQYGRSGNQGWATHIMATTIASRLITLSASYSVSGGGTGYSAPVLTYVFNNATLTATVTSSPQTFNVDTGSLWSVSPQLPGSSASERWVALQVTSGTVQSSQTVSVTYEHEFNVSFTAQVGGSLSGSGTPTATFSLMGHPTSVSLIQSPASANSYNGWSWVSAGSAYSYGSPLPGSNDTLRWVSSNPSGVVSASTNVSASYIPQSAYTIYATPSGIPGSLQGAFSAIQNGTSTTPTVTTQPTIFWLDVGGAWSVSPSISIDTGTRLICTGTSSGLVGQATTLILPFQTQYLLTISGRPDSAGIVSPVTGWFAQGTLINLSATANTGWEAAGWTGTGDASFTGSASSGSFLLNGPATEVVSFIPGLTITAAQGGSVSYTCGSVQGSVAGGTAKTIYVPINSTVSLFAQPSSSISEFSSWSGDAQGSSSTAVLSLTAPKSVEATFGTSLLLLLAVAAVVLALALAAVVLLRRRPSSSSV